MADNWEDIDDGWEDVGNEPVEKPSQLDEWWNWGNTPLYEGPSRAAKSISEPLMQYGESHPGLLGKIASYGGAYGQSVGDVTSGLTNPINLGLFALTEGASGVAGAATGAANPALKAALTTGAKALETPGRLAGVGMIGHGIYGATDSERPTSERLASVVEAILGRASMRSHVNSPHEVIKPKIAEDAALAPNKGTYDKIKKLSEPNLNTKAGIKQIGGSDAFEPGGVVDRYIKAVEGEKIPRDTPLTEFVKLESEGFKSPKEIPVTESPWRDTPDEVVARSQESTPELTSQSNPVPMEASMVGDWFDKVLGRKGKVPIKPETERVRNPTDSVVRLKSVIQEGLVARKAQDALASQERAIRAGMISGVKTPGLKGYHEQLGMLKGELPKIKNESLLNQQDVDSLLDAVTNSELRPYEQINAKSGLIKLMSGIAPQMSEIKHLKTVFGDEMEEIIMLHGGLGAINPGHIVSNVVNLPKSVMATLDLSAPLRQGLPLIAKGEYWNAFNQMFKYAGSEKAFAADMQAIIERPNYALGDDNGLFLSKLGDDLVGREEQFMSPLAEKIPLFGRAVKGSERAYVGFLNKLRADVFDSLIKQAKDMGHDVNTLAPEIAKFVNTSTGRGSLGRFEKNAVELNALMFSPRLVASRLTMLDPNYYINADPFVRREALKALFSVAGAGVTVATLMKRAGATVSTDPTSSDFGKAKFGNTRLDPYGGFQQYVVAASRMITGKSTSSTGRKYNLGEKFVGPSRQSVAIDFARSKESPIVSFIDTMLQGQKAFKPGGVGQEAANYFALKGTKGRVSAEVINRYTPMILSDLIELYKEDPDLLPLIALGGLGMGVQTFGGKSSTPSVTNP